MAESWKATNKFRLFVIVMLSLLTSVAAIPSGMITARAVVALVIQAAIAAFAFLMCPAVGIKAKTVP